MTRKLLQASHEMVKLATDPAFMATLNHLSAIPPRPSTPRDATSMINDEGRLRGWLDCVEYLRQIHIPTPVRETREIDLYGQPE